MGALGEAGRGTEEGQSQIEALLREIAENTARLGAFIQETQPAESDPRGRNQLEIRREGLRFGQARPTFRRHRDKWDDFAAQFCRARTDYGVDDDQTKRGLFSGVEGAQSRLVIAGMDPDRQAMHDISFWEYLQQIGEKFRPAAESIQMKEEYLNRTQRAKEDVQSYVGEKTELFRAAFPHASQREWSGCWMETAEGLCNRYVRNQMMASEPCDAEDFLRRAVRAVQAERARIHIGDSTEGRDGLEPVSRQIAVGEKEMAKLQRQGRSPSGEERGRPRREGTARRSPPTKGIHELQRARRSPKKRCVRQEQTPQEEEEKSLGPRGSGRRHRHPHRARKAGERKTQ